MFAQQLMNRHNMANQPMGILASSPQLMNAAQGFKDGGQVVKAKDGVYNTNNKNYVPRETITGTVDVANSGTYAVINPDFGKVEGAPPFITNVELAKKQLGENQNVGEPKENIKSVSELEQQQYTGDPDALKKLMEKKDSKGGGNDPIVDDYGEKKSATNDNMQPGVTNNQGLGENEGPGVLINETNAKLTQTDKELKEAIPEGKNLGLKTDTSKFDAKITEAANSYEKHKAKLGKTDNRYNADDAKRKDYMGKIEGIIEEEEDDIDLNSVDKKAREVLGLKKGEYDDDKVTAFWMSMIKGGLATAAGESGNALTNIAKGLAFGVESYGKDLNSISEDEREDRQNLAKMKYNLMKDEKSAKTAERTLRIQAYGELAKIDENKYQFKTENEYKVARNVILDNMAMAKLDLTSMQVLNGMKMGDLNYEAKIREISLNEDKQKDYVRLTEKQLSMQLRDKASTKEIKNIFALGSDYATYEDGEFEFTTKGRAMLIASVATKTTFTDLARTAKSVAATGKIRGYKFGSADATEKAYYYYEGITKPAIKALSGDTKDFRGVNKEAIAAGTKKLLDQFAKDTGGSLIDGSVGEVNVAFRSMPQQIIDKNYKDKDTFTSNGVKYIVGPNNTFKEVD